MNRAQRKLTVIALIYVLITLMAAPWEGRRGYSAIAPVFLPLAGYHLRLDCLIGEWLGVGIMYAGIFALLQKQPKAVSNGGEVQSSQSGQGKRRRLSVLIKVGVAVMFGLLVLGRFLAVSD